MGFQPSASFWKDPSQCDELYISDNSFEEVSAPRTITSIIKGHILGSWPTRGKAPPPMKKQLFETFKDVYKWPQHNDDEIYHVWNEISVNQHKDMFSHARETTIERSKSINPNDWKNYMPCWISDVNWRGCIKKSCSSKWQEISETNSKNHASEEHGGPPKHRGSSVSFDVPLARWRKEYDGKDPTPYQFFDKLHKVEEDIYIDQKAQKTHEKYISGMDERYGLDVESHPDFDLDAWNEATGGLKNGRTYGLGSSQLALQVVNASCPSKGKTQSNGGMDAMRQRIEELERENVENVTNVGNPM